MSPPQLEAPEVKTSGRRVLVTLADSLKPNTTYTVDFGDAIVDNNEGNPLGNFTYTFSTGPDIDSMQVAGTVLAGRQPGAGEGDAGGSAPPTWPTRLSTRCRSTA